MSRTFLQVPPRLSRTDRDRLERLIRRFRRRHRVPTAAVVEVTVADDALLEQLNRKYRHRPGPTDVLSFQIGRGAGEPEKFWIFGEVYISLDRAREQSRGTKVRLVDELERLAAHGLLHLVGYNHRSISERRVMDAAADTLIGDDRRGTV